MKIAVAQIRCDVGNVAANLRRLGAFGQRAKQGGAEWMVFPEMSDTGYVMSVIREHASSWSKGAVPQLRSAARKLALGIIGGVSEREGEFIYNSQVVIDAHGEIVGKYRKAHLFRPRPVEEHKCFAAGAELATFEMGKLRAGLSICYDLRFPELYRALAFDGGANIFVISSAWPAARVEHLRTLAAARAIENQSYVVLANRVGTDGGVTFCGNSAIIDPGGKFLATAPADHEELLAVDVSKPTVARARKRMPVFEHTRAEIYRSLKHASAGTVAAAQPKGHRNSIPC